MNKFTKILFFLIIFAFVNSGCITKSEVSINDKLIQAIVRLNMRGVDIDVDDFTIFVRNENGPFVMENGKVVYGFTRRFYIEVCKDVTIETLEHELEHVAVNRNGVKKQF